MLPPALLTLLFAVSVDPPRVTLSGPDASYSLLVSSKDGDRTRNARYASADPAIAHVDERGVVHARRDGSTVVTVSVDGETLRVPVTVSGSSTSRVHHFENDIIPL